MHSVDAHASLRERDGKLKNNWYIVCLSRELKGGAKPLGRMLYDTPLVIYRKKDGTPICLHDRCLHRHAQLSEGDVFDDLLGCPYHGWVYNEHGEVVEVPSSGCQNKCSQVEGLRIRTFPCHEQDDCIWVWMGEEEPDVEVPPYRFPYYKAPGWHSYYMITDFDNEVTSLVENFMDVPHTVFVHAGWFRKTTEKVVPIDVDVTDREVLVTYKQENDTIGFTGRILNPRGAPMFHTDRFIMPNITRVDYRFGEDGFIISSQCSPISTLKTRVYTEITYRLGPLSLPLKPFFRYYTRKVINQDVDIMANQGRNLAIDPVTNFHNTDADILHEAIEDLRKFGAKGATPPLTFIRSESREIWI